jgi:hypothetical protein
VKTLRALLVGLALAVAFVACGGDDEGGGGDTDDTDEETTTTAAFDEAAETAAIEELVTEYFRLLGVGDIDAAVPLLENGEEWRDEMVACTSLTTSQSVTATVKSVEFTDATNATAIIDILGPEQAVLQPDAGAGAVKIDGTWVVSSATFESLYDLAKDACTAGGITTTSAP